MLKDKIEKDLKEGKEKELELISILEDKGCTYKKSTDWLDKREHWDYAFRDKKEQFDLKPHSDDLDYYRIDIKGAKKFKHHDDHVNYDHHWVELTNPYGYKGWVYGKADYIVFEIKNQWIFVDREKLKDHIEEKTKGEITWSTAHKENYKLYRRDGRKDRITWVPVKDLLTMCDLELDKI